MSSTLEMPRRRTRLLWANVGLQVGAIAATGAAMLTALAIGIGPKIGESSTHAIGPRTQLSAPLQADKLQLERSIRELQQGRSAYVPSPNAVSNGDSIPDLTGVKDAKHAFGMDSIGMQGHNAPGTLTLYASRGAHYQEMKATLSATGVRYATVTLPHGVLYALEPIGFSLLFMGLIMASAFGGIGRFYAGQRWVHRKRGLYAWKALVNSELLGPQTPQRGFQLVVPETEQVGVSDGSRLRFAAATYQFTSDYNGAGMWQRLRRDLSDRVWTPEEQVEMVEAWVEHCTTIAADNVVRWRERQEQIRRDREAEEQAAAQRALEAQEAEARLEAERLTHTDLRELLPAPAQIVDLAALSTSEQLEAGSG